MSNFYLNGANGCLIGDGNKTWLNTEVRPASDEPNPGPPVLAQGLKGQWFVVSTKMVWSNTVSFYDIKKWCYLPEGKV